MHLNKIINKIANFSISGVHLFYIAFLALYISSFMKTTTYADYVSPNLISRMSYLVVGILLLKIYFFDSLNIKIFSIDTIIFILAVVVWRKTHAFDIVIYASLILGAKNVNFRSLIKWFFMIGLIMITFVIISSQLGIIKDLVYMRNGFGRHSFGINYPTDFGAHILFLILAYCYLRFIDLSWKDYFAFSIIGVILMLLTQARLDVIAIFVTIIVVLIAQKAYKGVKLFREVASFFWIIPVLFAYVAVVASYFYSSSNRIFDLFNNLFSERLRLSHLAISDYGIKLFGNLITERGFGGSSGFHSFHVFGMGEQYFYIDSSFIRLFVIYGLVTAILFVILMTVIALRSILKSDFCMAGIIVLISISCLVEPHLLDIAFNPFLIAFTASNVYYKKIRRNQSEKL
ncbi:hypothetical protein [Limosilactobacillus fastidiosus]|uniref:Polymerase n=1 Tax=Limosilactobacillus fastidiosus TaxID=2759855 RepID=A0ABR6E8K6_9LACO|nr:hypothetical protein [Limosilactobacillus fastidiosus]MBB1063532.1 hypothetical protein [Limosilactobacillus fastidiosus]MCD7084887.1 hypothetical protein [Limosilactobacillus fastidiosus]